MNSTVHVAVDNATGAVDGNSSAGQNEYSPASASILFALAVIGAWAVQTLYTAYSSPLRSLPGPWISHFTNLRLKVAIVSGRRIFYIHDLHRRYGPVVRLSPTELSVTDVEGYKKIHSVTSKFVKDIWYEKLTNFPRHSVFSMLNAKDHAMRRRLYARGFSKTHLREHWETTVMEKAKLAVSRIHEDAIGGKADLMKWWQFMATDIVGRLGFGESFGMLERGEKSEYVRIMELALVGNGIGADLPWVRSILSVIPIRIMRETFKASAYLMDYGMKAATTARSGNEKANFMASVIAEAEKEEGATLDDLDVCTESTSLIFAGSGTTTNSLTYLCWAALTQPELQKALEDEVGQLRGDFTDADLEALPLLSAVIQETLRLYAAVPGTLPRVVPKGGVTINDNFIPEGITVGTQAYTLHRDESIYPEPYKFSPHRWLPASPSNSHPLPPTWKATWCPFGAGAYTCLGQHLALMEMRCAAALFFRECRGARLHPLTTAKSMEFENYFVITPKGHRCDVVLDE